MTPCIFFCLNPDGSAVLRVRSLRPPLTGDGLLSALLVAGAYISWVGSWHTPTAGSRTRKMLPTSGRICNLSMCRRTGTNPRRLAALPAYLKESLASRDAAPIINVEGRLVWCNDAVEYLLDIGLTKKKASYSLISHPKLLKKYFVRKTFRSLRVRLGQTRVLPAV